VIRPRLTFIAGANGSGKTTLTRWNALFREIPLLDPDAIANMLQATGGLAHLCEVLISSVS
jgi:predicted ABC-type ATPase